MTDTPDAPPVRRQRYVPAVGKRLKKLLFVVFGLFALLAVNSVYLLAVRGFEAATGNTYQNWFYLLMFLGHLVLGLLIVVPVILFGAFHFKNAHDRPNRRAVRVGYALFTTALLLLVSGIVLTRIEGVIVVKDPAVRSLAWWVHVLTPLLAAWLFVLHRLAGRRIQWKVGARWAMVAGAFAVVMLAFHSQDPRQWDVEGPESGERYFFPSLARTATGNFIPERALTNDRYCAECHADVHEQWSHSVHKFSSFNNPPYLFSVRETRKVSLLRDGELRASRWCAGCHDPVVFFSGKFDDPEFDDVEDPSGQAGITCSVCHGITHVNSTRGNADYTIEESVQYPFAYSEDARLGWVNRQLVKAKPDLHKKTFLKPLHRTAELCSTCHKVHLPPELNHYKWLRGQNHYDAYLLSGVSGHGVASFYYPPKATHNCQECHMPTHASDDFGAQDFDQDGGLQVHDHMFPSANTGIPHLLDLPDWVNQKHLAFNDGVMRVDLFGIKEGAAIDGALTAPLRPEVPVLEPGRSYLLEAVIRTVKMGHLFTQGTADSNEIWLDVTVWSDGRVIGRSGGLGERNEVDPWSHFVNVYMLDRHGNRIDRRNAQDIFVPLYNHQIPPGAADVIHYALALPADVSAPVTVEAKLQYRKFDTTYMQHVYGAEFVNDLPILTLATDRVTFPVAGGPPASNDPSPVEEWQRWNDYGIGLLRKGGKSKGELRQAEEAFQRVEAMGRPDGPLNLARVYLAQGTVQDKAITALERAAAFDPSAPQWTVAWLTGQVNKQNGYLDEAIAAFRSIVDSDTAETRQRELDFSQDYNLLNELGQTLFERAKQERGEARRTQRVALMREAATWFERTLAIDSESAMAHYNLGLLYKQLGDDAKGTEHLQLYQRYKPDDNARDRVVAIHRAANPAADFAAEAIVIYDLRRDGAFELGLPLAEARRARRYEIGRQPESPGQEFLRPVAAHAQGRQPASVGGAP
ncbi:MAG TPA: multiheme c-type cytochrome [Thermoanaerobaculia bacterium]|nr:multiheme c-type cytochrome [Thermoanaerobaculia bacterium]